jgi:hypothetical protein
MTANDTWTIALWANEASDGSGNYVATYGRFLSQDGGAGFEWDSGANTDSQYYFWHSTITAWQQGFGTSSAVTPVFDKWTHLAMVYDGRNLTLYRNGNQGALGGKVSIPVNASLNFPGYAGAVQIGSELDIDAGRNWNGLLDDVAIFTGALNESQLQTVMSGDFTAFQNTAPLLSLETSGGKVVVLWGFGILQTSTNLTSGWQDQPALTSPLIIDPSAARQFYRVRR